MDNNPWISVHGYYLLLKAHNLCSPKTFCFLKHLFSHQMDAIDYIVQYSDKVGENKTKNQLNKITLS